MMSQTFITKVKNEAKNNFSLSIPLVAAQLIYASSSFIGTAFVAKLGPASLAASVLVSTIWMSLSVLFFGVLHSISVLVAHQYGARNDEAISRIMGQSYIAGLGVCLIIIAILFNLPYFLRWSNQPPAVLILATEYVYALIWTIPALVILIIFEEFLAGIGRTKMVLRISVLIVPIEIPLIYFLIFGKFGFPACGVAGIGYGFAITYTLSAFFLTLYLLRSKHYKRFKLFDSLGKIHVSYLKELIRLGLPLGFMHMIEVAAFAVAAFWMGHFGTTILAAHQIILQFLGFAITLVFAMAQAVTIRVGHAVGQNNLSAVYYAIYVGLFLNTFLILIVAIGFYFFPTLFLQIDMNIEAPANKLLVEQSAVLLSICGILLIFDNFRIIGTGALRGLKDMRFPMYTSFASFWLIGLVMSYLLGFYWHLEGKGIWWGLTFGVAVGALMELIRLQYLLKRINLSSLITPSPLKKRNL